MDERDHILKVLKGVKISLEKKDYINLKRLSDKVIEHTSVHQDIDLISVAVIIYALSKLIEREHYKTDKSWNEFYRNFLKNISDMTMALEKNDINTFRDEVRANSKLLKGLSGKFKDYMGDVFRKARINKASKIYSQGISMEKTARMLGVSLWEISEFTGQSGVGNVNLGVTMKIEDRVKLAMEIFK